MDKVLQSILQHISTAPLEEAVLLYRVEIKEKSLHMEVLVSQLAADTDTEHPQSTKDDGEIQHLVTLLRCLDLDFKELQIKSLQLTRTSTWDNLLISIGQSTLDLLSVKSI